MVKNLQEKWVLRRKNGLLVPVFPFFVNIFSTSALIDNYHLG